jgi:glycosidase
MNPKTKTFLAAAFFCVSTISGLFPPPAHARGLETPVIDVEAGSVVEMPLDLFVGAPVASGPAVTNISGAKSVRVSVAPKRSALVISAPAGFSGFDAFVVSASSDGKTTFSRAVAVRVTAPRRTVLRYKPAKSVKSVAAAGDFNSWNPSASPMTGPDKKGFYSIELKLAAGEYNYKFVVDGQWLADTANPASVPDGFGGTNSVVFVGAPPKSGRWHSVVVDDTTARVAYIAGKAAPSFDAASLLLVSGDKILARGGDYSVDETRGEIAIKLASLGSPPADVMILARDKSGAILSGFVARFPSDDGWNGRLMYFAFTDRFHSGSAANDRPSGDPDVAPAADFRGGDFAGITEKLRDGYFERLGVGALWISPHFKNPDRPYIDALPPHRKFTGYHGYWPVSFDETDPRFGTIEELRELVAAAHKRGIKVILDMVLNHAHEENPVYKKNPGWFSKITLADGRKNIRLFDERPLDTWFDDFLPDFAYEGNPAAVEYMVSNCLDWIKKTNCDGFRLDAVKHVPMVFWTELRRRIRRDIEIPRGEMFYLVGETISGREKIMEYVGFDKLDGQFDFPIYWAIKDVFAWQTKGLDYLERESGKSALQYVGSIPSPLLGNHDFARFSAFADGAIPPGSNEKARSWDNRPEVKNRSTYQKLRMAFAFLLSEPGVPMIYYGDEIGLSGAGDPDNRRMMKFDKLSGDERETLQYVGALAAFRRASKALRFGERHTLVSSENTLVYLKNYFGETAVVAINRSPRPAEVSVELPPFFKNPASFEDVVSGKKIQLKKLRIPPMSAVVLRGI